MEPLTSLPSESRDIGLAAVVSTLREEVEVPVALIYKALKQERLYLFSTTTDTLMRKNTELDTQRVKLKQYEFAIQESLVFLGKPLNRYDEWINSELVQELNIEFPKELPVTSSMRNSTPIAKIKSTTVTSEMSVLEINCMESMKLCFNFLRSCQKNSLAIDNGSYTIPLEVAVQTDENESLALTKDDSKVIAVSRRESMAVQMQVVVTDDTTEGDLSLEPVVDFKSTAQKSNCEKCHKAFLRIDEYKDTIKDLESRNVELQAKTSKEIAVRKICQQAKQMIDQEIEEITAELFSRANQMVVEESRKMDQLNTSNRELTKKAQDFLSRLKDTEEELGQATKSLYQMQGTQSIDVPEENAIPKIITSHSIYSGFDQFKSSIAADGYIFQEFQDLMKVMVLSASLPSIQAFQAIHSTQFIKRCMIESIEPCLFYTYHPNSSFKSLGTGLTVTNKKKLLDSCIKGLLAVTIESETKSKCSVCTILRSCEYKLTMDKDLSPLCRFCRDRVLSVQDFFSFITLLSNGKHGFTILSAFKQSVWRRRRIAQALLGSCSMFESELTAILGIGATDLNGNREKQTRTLY